MITSPLIPFIKNTDVTGSRVLGTTYTNNTGKIMHVTVSLSHGAAAIGNNAMGSFTLGGAVKGYVGIAASPIAALYIKSTLSFIVPVGSTYVVAAVVSGAGATTLDYWSETI